MKRSTFIAGLLGLPAAAMAASKVGAPKPKPKPTTTYKLSFNPVDYRGDYVFRTIKMDPKSGEFLLISEPQGHYKIK